MRFDDLLDRGHTKSYNLVKNRMLIISLLIFGIAISLFSFDVQLTGQHLTLKEMVGLVLGHIAIVLMTIAILDFVHVQNLDKEQVELIKKILDKNSTLHKAYYDFGVINIHDKLPENLTDYVMSSGKIMIVQTYMPNLDIIQDELVKVLSSPDKLVEVEIYLLNPFSEIVAKRNQILFGASTSDNVMETKIWANLVMLRQIGIDALRNRNGNGANMPVFKLFLYDFGILPAFDLYRFGDRQFIGYFTLHKEATRTMHIEIYPDGAVGRQVAEEITSIKNAGTFIEIDLTNKTFLDKKVEEWVRDCPDKIPVPETNDRLLVVIDNS